MFFLRLLMCDVSDLLSTAGFNSLSCSWKLRSLQVVLLGYIINLGISSSCLNITSLLASYITVIDRRHTSGAGNMWEQPDSFGGNINRSKTTQHREFFLSTVVSILYEFKASLPMEISECSFIVFHLLFSFTVHGISARHKWSLHI